MINAELAPPMGAGVLPRRLLTADVAAVTPLFNHLIKLFQRDAVAMLDSFGSVLLWS